MFNIFAAKVTYSLHAAVGYVGDLTSGHSDQKSAAEQLAKEFKVGEKTIRRDAKFTLAVEAIAGNCGEKAKQLILSRDVGLHRKQVLGLAKMKPKEQQLFFDTLAETGKPPKRRPAGKRTTMTLPADPKALVEALVRRFSRDEAVQVARLLEQVLKSRKPASKTNRR